jgi:hypothetical protein
MSMTHQGVRRLSSSLPSHKMSKVFLRSRGINLHHDPDDDDVTPPTPVPAKSAKPKRRPPQWGPDVVPATLEDGYVGGHRPHLMGKKLEDFDPNAPQLDCIQAEAAVLSTADRVDLSKLRRVAFPPPHVADVTRRGSGLAGLIVPEWAMEVVADTERSADSVRKVLCYLAYWQMPKADGRPRSGEAIRIVRSGVWWFATGAARIGRVFGLSAGHVAEAIDRLIQLGLVERLSGKAAVWKAEAVLDDDTIFARIRWEVVAHLWATEQAMKPHQS